VKSGATGGAAKGGSKWWGSQGESVLEWSVESGRVQGRSAVR
jgi:hypothetical protein